MQKPKINPFHELYVTETIPPKDFVELFSPFLVKHALALFQPGNIFLTGIQGSGKSMLLNLLKTEIRTAYLLANKPFPIPGEYSRFIGAGIHIVRSGANNFGQRTIQSDDSDLTSFPIYFGDFINYLIVYDVLESIEKLQCASGGMAAAELGISCTTEQFDSFAHDLSQRECWFGYLNSNDYAALKRQIQDRIQHYRKFMNYNINTLPSVIRNTKTTIGIPVSETVQMLWQSQIIDQSTPVHIRIDQYEELGYLESWNKALSLQFQQIINKLLSTRDARVSYKIGVRRYGWQSELKVYGTAAKLERERDYKVVDLDDILTRKENRRTWVFPHFAKDVFTKRLCHAGYLTKSHKTDPVTAVMQQGLSPAEKALKYAGNSPSRALRIEPEWPTEWKMVLSELVMKDPLSEKLGEAWIRQKGISEPVPNELPWESASKGYWRKERIPQALMQIAGRCGQRMIWAGKDNLLTLSGGNILIFVSICQHIWDTWLRSLQETVLPDSETILPRIDFEIQALGIQAASSYWYSKIPEQPGGSGRQRFIEFIGNLFNRELFNDVSMSYPGQNGFSIRIDELESSVKIAKYLSEAVDYGDLVSVSHTTKYKDRKPRIKWYIKPILSPYFKIPEQHTKEPRYVSLKELTHWLYTTNALPGKPYKQPAAHGQLNLFSKEDG